MARRAEFDIAVKLTNDQSGASAVAYFPSDNAVIPVSSLLSSSPLVAGGRILATSAEMQNLAEYGNRDVKCVFSLGGSVVEFSNLATWADLDQVPGAALVDVTDATIACLAGEERF